VVGDSIFYDYQDYSEYCHFIQPDTLLAGERNTMWGFRTLQTDSLSTIINQQQKEIDKLTVAVSMLQKANESLSNSQTITTDDIDLMLGLYSMQQDLIDRLKDKIYLIEKKIGVLEKVIESRTFNRGGK
jgi:peptidoglycan hydrolase CwlO-like protein